MMFKWKYVLLVLMFMGLNQPVLAQKPDSPCSMPVFSNENVKEIIRRERLVRNDLPPAPAGKTEVKVKRQGCYYLYNEWQVPKFPGGSIQFTLDQYGVIVDVKYGY